MNILVNILVALACLLIGYVLGSANISIPIGKMVFKQDPREYGSHNCGATNCGRLWGKKYFFIVFFFDVIKTIGSLYLCWAILTFVPLNNGTPLLPTAWQMYCGGDLSAYVIQWPIYWLACLGATLGNVFPLFTRFRGGKAASTYIGLTFTSSWAFGVIGAISYFSVLLKTRYVSLSSILCGVVNVIVTWVWAILIMLKVFPTDNIYMLFLINWGPMLYMNYVYAITMTIMVAIMIYRHHENIARLRAGNERKIGWLKSKEKVNN